MPSRVRLVTALIAILLAAVCLFQGASQDPPLDPARVAGPLSH